MENNPRLESYIKRQIELCDTIMNAKVKLNGKPLRARSLFSTISDYIREFESGRSERRWVIIPGLRGTGKTTILAQSYFFIKQNFKNANVIYFSVDDAMINGFSLLEVLEAYMAEIKQQPETAKKVFILLDEVQSAEDWVSTLKTYHDKAPGIFLLCSGSSAVNLQTNADVAGRRADIECLYPMSFSEYELIEHNLLPTEGLSEEINAALYASANAEECYARLKANEAEIAAYCQNVKPSHWAHYLKSGSLPFTLSIRDEGSVYRQVLQTVEKVIHVDLPQIESIDSKSIITAMSLLRLLSDADSISVSKVAAMLNINAITLNGILNALCKAELLIRIVPYGSNFSAARKNSKYLFASSTIRAALHYLNGSPTPPEKREGYLLEDVAGLYFYKHNNARHLGDVFYDSAREGADFIVRTGETAVVFETGRGRKDSTQASNTLERIGSRGRYGVTICNTKEIALSDNKQNVFIPWKVFALSE